MHDDAFDRVQSVIEWDGDISLDGFLRAPEVLDYTDRGCSQKSGVMGEEVDFSGDLKGATLNVKSPINQIVLRKMRGANTLEAANTRLTELPVSGLPEISPQPLGLPILLTSIRPLWAVVRTCRDWLER